MDCLRVRERKLKREKMKERMRKNVKVLDKAICFEKSHAIERNREKDKVIIQTNSNLNKFKYIF